VLQRQALCISRPDYPADLGHPFGPRLLKLLRGQGGAAAALVEDHRGQGQRNKTISKAPRHRQPSLARMKIITSIGLWPPEVRS
jgi:hypothetical protein